MDEQDLNWVVSETKILLPLKQFYGNFLKHKLSRFSEMQNDA